MIPLKDKENPGIFPFWVILIILLNIYVFYQELTSHNPEFLVSQFGLVPGAVELMDLSSLIPFVTSQFLHAGFLHIISNMLFLWVFGDNIEDAFGFVFFPIFYLLSGVVASLTQILFTPTASIPMIGASGAVAGVLGAYFALFPFNKVKTLLFIFIFVTIVEVPAYFLLFFWFITQLFSGATTVSLDPNVGGIAFLPHVGGFLFGWITAMFLPKSSESRGLLIHH